MGAYDNAKMIVNYLRTEAKYSEDEIFFDENISEQRDANGSVWGNTADIVHKNLMTKKKDRKPSVFERA